MKRCACACDALAPAVHGGAVLGARAGNGDLVLVPRGAAFVAPPNICVVACACYSGGRLCGGGGIRMPAQQQQVHTGPSSVLFCTELARGRADSHGNSTGQRFSVRRGALWRCQSSLLLCCYSLYCLQLSFLSLLATSLYGSSHIFTRASTIWLCALQQCHGGRQSENLLADSTALPRRYRLWLLRT